MKELMEKIDLYQQKLREVAKNKDNPLVDEEVYNISCELDKLIVKLMKLQKETAEKKVI